MVGKYKTYVFYADLSEAILAAMKEGITVKWPSPRYWDGISKQP